jgi:hypothetical protein
MTHTSNQLLTLLPCFNETSKIKNLITLVTKKTTSKKNNLITLVTRTTPSELKPY